MRAFTRLIDRCAIRARVHNPDMGSNWAIGILLLYEYYPIQLVGGVIGALLCTWLSRGVMRVLQVPQEYAAERKRDRAITFVIYLPAYLPWLGMIRALNQTAAKLYVIPGLGLLPYPGAWVVLYTYAVGIHKHLRDLALHGLAAKPKLPRIPQFGLSELLVMVFSVGASPLIYASGSGGAYTLVWAILIFPLCFAGAFLRLDANKVPLGSARLEFLFLYPYSLLSWSTLFSMSRLTFLHTMQRFGNSQTRMVGHFLNAWLAEAAVALLMIVLTYLVARRAKREAEAARAATTALRIES